MLDRSAVVVSFVLAGCNQIHGLDPTRIRDAREGGNGELLIDLDRDGISDEADPCLASMRDAEDDSLDGDGLPAASDPCPFESGTQDADQDGVPDICDPFPSANGDRMRCYMSFVSTDLNDLLWRSRDATRPWSSSPGELTSGSAGLPSGYVSVLDLERTMQTTYEAFVTLSNANTGIYGFRMWARAADGFDNKELGCEISGDPMSTRFAVVRGNDMDVAASTLIVPFPRSMPVRIRLTIAAGGTGTDIRCRFEIPTGERTVKAHIAEQPPGRFAFGTEALLAQISALAIYERDDVQPLP